MGDRLHGTVHFTTSELATVGATGYTVTADNGRHVVPRVSQARDSQAAVLDETGECCASRASCPKDHSLQREDRSVHTCMKFMGPRFKLVDLEGMESVSLNYDSGSFLRAGRERARYHRSGGRAGQLNAQ